MDMPHRDQATGAVAPDGSPVEFYLLLSAEDDPDIVQAAAGGGGSVLELGCGVGRVTHALVARGYDVVAVDESAEMLAHVRGAQRVKAEVQNLRLDRRFDCVMLTSYLINTPDDMLRQAFLDVCRRHVGDDGCVLIQWQPAEAHDRWEIGRGRTHDGITITMIALDRPTPSLARATMQYEAAGRIWTQSFTSRRLTDEELDANLSRAGLKLDRFLTEDRTWVRAVPRVVSGKDVHHAEPD